MFPFLVDKIFDAHKRVCNVCGADVFDDRGFCQVCFDSLPFNDGKTCKLCGSKLLTEESYCPNCKPDRVFFDRAFSSFDYDDAIKTLLYDFKYGGSKYLAKIFAPYMVATWYESGINADCVTYAPLSQKSFDKRGYNQAELLAKEFCSQTGIPLVKDAVTKIKDPAQQERLKTFERRANLLGAFALGSDYDFVGKTVVVIDDVKTTGTTLSRIAKQLKKAKAAKVYGLTVASARYKLPIGGKNEQQKAIKNFGKNC